MTRHRVLRVPNVSLTCPDTVSVVRVPCPFPVGVGHGTGTQSGEIKRGIVSLILRGESR